MNTDSVIMMLKFAGLMLLILGLVFGLACATPLLAKQVDKIRKKPPVYQDLNINPDEENADKANDVKGIYDAQLPEQPLENEDSGKENESN